MGRGGDGFHYLISIFVKKNSILYPNSTGIKFLSHPHPGVISYPYPYPFSYYFNINFN